jgi:UDP-N-acetylmuramoyl-tripeptide--D-alanyl-D-alanine ligase
MFTLNDILQGNAGKVHIQSNTAPDGNLAFRSAHHDSRLIAPGDLFIARKGASIDGHRFISAAARAGALGALCSEPVTNLPPDFLQIIVPDVLYALHTTARIRTQRQEHTIRIGITGSNGKTGTKDAVAAVLKHKAPTLKTYASYNHELGYPITLLRLEPQHRYAVLELGAQRVGELSWLCDAVASPHWSIITNVGTSHLEHFGTQERVALAKSELVQVLAPDGLALLNYDDKNVHAMATKTQARVLYYGMSEGADVYANNISGDILFGCRCTLHYHGQQRSVQLRLPGKHGITIALAATAAGCAAGMSLDEISLVLEELTPAPGRGEIKPGPNNSILIDDSYNASRQSIITIAQTMHNATQAPNGRRWAILGDILELGAHTRSEHTACGSALAGLVDYLIVIGDQARFYVEGALTAGMPEKNAYYFSADINNTLELEAAKRAAADLIKREVRPGDLLLFKGSRGIQMETMLTML